MSASVVTDAHSFIPPGAPEGHRVCAVIGGCWRCECTAVFMSANALGMHHAFATSDAIAAKLEAERDGSVES